MAHSPRPAAGPAEADFRPLQERPAWPDVRQFRRRMRKARVPGTRQAGAGTAPVLVVAVVPVFLLAWLAFAQIGSRLSGSQPVPAAVLAAGLAAVAFGWLAALTGRSAWSRWYRIDRFAAANGFRWQITAPNPEYPGMVFQRGSDRACGETIETTAGRPLRLGEYRYTTGKGKNRKVHRWGFVALRLEHPMPHMVLDARANNYLTNTTNLPTLFRRDQILHLEGDFDRHFTLYCPRDYEQDALYLFTPDLMALLLDHASTFDAEIVDDWLFFYAARPFDIAHPQTMRRLLSLAGLVGERLARQAARYRDGHAAPVDGSAAPDGARLRPRIPWLGILVTAAAIAVLLAFLL